MVFGNNNDPFSSSSLHNTMNNNNNKKKKRNACFYIGSVEALEEKLRKDQSHVHPQQWIPVESQTQTNYALEALKTFWDWQIQHTGDSTRTSRRQFHKFTSLPNHSIMRLVVATNGLPTVPDLSMVNRRFRLDLGLSIARSTSIGDFVEVSENRYLQLVPL